MAAFLDYANPREGQGFSALIAQLGANLLDKGHAVNLMQSRDAGKHFLEG